MCLAALGLAAAPSIALGGAPRRIGILRTETGSAVAKPLLDALADLGYRLDRDLQVQTRIVQPVASAFEQGAEELVRGEVEVLVAISTPAALAAQKATRTIPVVMSGSDPVRLGFAASLARPGGNITGVTTSPDTPFRGKMLALLKEAAPRIVRIAVVLDPAFQLIRWSDMEAAARSLGVDAFAAVAEERLDRLVRHLTDGRADALLAFPNAQVNAYQRELAGFALGRRLPTMFGSSMGVRAGALMSYFADWADLGRKAARLVDKILKGERPAELPIEQPERFQLALNLRTARELGLQVPSSLLVQATEVIR